MEKESTPLLSQDAFSPRQRAFAGNRYNWVDSYIEHLDPDSEYNEIVRTVTLFRGTEFFTNIDYVTNTILVNQEPKGAEAMTCTGKSTKYKQKRFEDTMATFRIWFANGSQSEETKNAMVRLNRLHMTIAKKVPGNFDGDDDFVIAVCRMGVANHQLQKRLGFPGFSDTMKKAWYHFCTDMIRQFEKESGPITTWPADFEGMVKFSDDFCSRDWTPSPFGEHVGKVILEQFVERWSPFPATDFIYRQMPLTFLPESIIKLHKIGRRRPWLEALIVLYFQIKFILIALFPDPRKPTFAPRWPSRLHGALV